MLDTTLTNQIDRLTDAVLLLAKSQGTRLSREQVCERLGICRQTLTKRVINKEYPQPLKDGKWLLADIIEFETRQKRGY